MTNMILNTDSYKLSHYEQYPPNTTKITSYIESRGVEAGRDWDRHVFFGLQGLIATDWDALWMRHIHQTKSLAEQHGVPFNEAGWWDLHRYQMEHGSSLPLYIEAIPEGSVVPFGTPLVQVFNTDKRFFWLTSYIETELLRAVWYPSTVATQSFHIKRKLKDFLLRQGSSLTGLDFMLHDFGARGASSEETAKLGGAAHLTVFKGTDTLVAIPFLMYTYQASGMPGFSVPAAEHSTITSWGKEREVDAYRNMINRYKRPNGIISIVSDSYDIYNACDQIYGVQLKDEIKALGDINCKLVIRPDSGEPKLVLQAVLDILYERFKEDWTETANGYKVLPKYLRLLQGDGVNERSIVEILTHLEACGYAAENIVFGMGGALLQNVNRDTLKFAMKANEIEQQFDHDGGGTVIQDVYKSPVGGGKTSKRGRQAVVDLGDGQYEVCRYNNLGGRTNLMQPVYHNGRRFLDRLDDIRKRIDGAL